MSYLTRTPDLLPPSDEQESDLSRAMELLKEDEAMERYYEAKYGGEPC